MIMMVRTAAPLPVTTRTTTAVMDQITIAVAQMAIVLFFTNCVITLHHQGSRRPFLPPLSPSSLSFLVFFFGGGL